MLNDIYFTCNNIYFLTTKEDSPDKLGWEVILDISLFCQARKVNIYHMDLLKIVVVFILKKFTS